MRPIDLERVIPVEVQEWGSKDRGDRLGIVEEALGVIMAPELIELRNGLCRRVRGIGASVRPEVR